MPMQIRPVDPLQEPAIKDVVCAAFGSEVEYELVEALRAEEDVWVPEWSLGAYIDGELAGHILFTRAWAGSKLAALLAPLAVSPVNQNTGVGQALIEAGLSAARAEGAELSLVLGHPDYYPKGGFEPAMPHGILAPYPINPPEAWMVIELVEGALVDAAGVVKVAEALGAPELWRE
ncbi:MAG: N-acetyltransferase [Coriobacteriia bacterium]|nr:N-acetyltransferase [Coriobacteriia bacterium]